MMRDQNLCKKIYDLDLHRSNVLMLKYVLWWASFLNRDAVLYDLGGFFDRYCLEEGGYELTSVYQMHFECQGVGV